SFEVGGFRVDGDGLRTRFDCDGLQMADEGWRSDWRRHRWRGLTVGVEAGKEERKGQSVFAMRHWATPVVRLGDSVSAGLCFGYFASTTNNILRVKHAENLVKSYRTGVVEGGGAMRFGRRGFLAGGLA